MTSSPFSPKRFTASSLARVDREELVIPVRLLLDDIEGVVPRLPAGLDALWVPFAEVADHSLIGLRVQYGHLTRAGLDAEGAAGALLLVDDDRAGLLVDAEGVELAALDAGVVLALGAEVGHLQSSWWRLQAISHLRHPVQLR
jgi:hypothetical protein